ETPADADYLYRGFAAACRRSGRDVPAGLVLTAESEIPVARGLGSSAAAGVGGAAAAAVLLDLSLEGVALAELATELEGHPDNVAPAVFGGATLALQGPNGLIVAPLVVHASLAFVFAVPDFMVETKRARAALPATLPHQQAVRAAAKSAALVQGLAHGDARLLAAALDDVLHVPYRRALVRGYDEVTSAARQAGAYGATLSGSGPTVVALCPAARAAQVGEAIGRAARRRRPRRARRRESCARGRRGTARPARGGGAGARPRGRPPAGVAAIDRRGVHRAGPGGGRPRHPARAHAAHDRLPRGTRGAGMRAAVRGRPGRRRLPGRLRRCYRDRANRRHVRQRVARLAAHGAQRPQGAATRAGPWRRAGRARFSRRGAGRPS